MDQIRKKIFMELCDVIAIAYIKSAT